MITVVPFEMEHLDYLLPNLRDHDAKMVELYGGEKDVREMFDRVRKIAVTNSFITESGDVVAVWAFIKKWEGTAHCCAWTSALVDKMQKEFWKACKRGLDSAQEALGLHRLEADVRVDHPSGRDWLLRLGFETEGVMRQYGADKVDSYLMGRVW